MKKQTITTILAILVLTITTVGSTYAYFVATTTSDYKSNVARSGKFEVIYTGGTQIRGPIYLSTNKDGGLNTTVNIKVAEESVKAKATIYLNIQTLTENLSINGFKWEVIGTKNNVEVYSNSGNFQGIKEKDIVNIVEDYRLSEENTAFTIYLWIDGNLVDNSILNCEFAGFIGAKTEQLQGEL